jgi:hypothetical protein
MKQLLRSKILETDKSLEVTVVLRAVSLKERNAICANAAVHRQLLPQAHRYFTCTVTLLTLQALYQN